MAMSRAHFADSTVEDTALSWLVALVSSLL